MLERPSGNPPWKRLLRELKDPLFLKNYRYLHSCTRFALILILALAHLVWCMPMPIGTSLH